MTLRAIVIYYLPLGATVHIFTWFYAKNKTYLFDDLTKASTFAAAQTNSNGWGSTDNKIVVLENKNYLIKDRKGG